MKHSFWSSQRGEKRKHPTDNLLYAAVNSLQLSQVGVRLSIPLRLFSSVAQFLLVLKRATICLDG